MKELETIIKKFENEINQRIAHLKDVDADFCKDRWDMTKPENERGIYREMSNQVTATRQELEMLKRTLSLPEANSVEANQDVREIANETYKIHMAAFAEGCGKPFTALAWHIYKRAFDIANYSLPKTKDGEPLFTEKAWQEKQILNSREMIRSIMSKGEFIICSAVNWQGKFICGRKHKDCYIIADALMTHGFLERERKHQGFMTSTGRFVDRAEAFKIAKANHQIVHKLFDGVEEGNLNSEDLFGEE
jgi:hypothetical protein